MKTSKKLLSVLLAVLMVMTSVSVCFTSFGADYSSSAFKTALSDLAEAFKTGALNASTFIGPVNVSSTNTFTITCEKYDTFDKVRDIVAKFQTAVEKTESYCKYPNAGSDASTRACADFETVRNEIINGLKSNGYMTDGEMGQYKATTFINNATSMTGAITHTNNKTSKNDVPERVWDYTNVTTDDYKGYLASEGVKSLADVDAIQLGYSFSMALSRENYQTGGSCTKTDHYHNAFNTGNAGTAPANNPNYKNDTAVKTKLNEHATYLANNSNLSVDAMVAKINAGTDTAWEKDYADKRADINTYVGGENYAVYNKLFSAYKDGIEASFNNLASARALADYINYSNDYLNYFEGEGNKGYGVYNYGGFEYDQLKADFDDFKTNIYDKLDAGGKDNTDYLVEKGYLPENWEDYYTNFSDNVAAYDLAAQVSEINAFYNANKDAYAEMTVDEQVVVKSTLVGYINYIGGYNAQVIDTFYSDSAEVSLKDLNTLNAEIEWNVNDNVVFFLSKTADTLQNAATSDIEAAIGQIPEKKAGLEALRVQVAEVVGAEKADELLAVPTAKSATLADDLYQLLADRFKSEVDAAYALYVELGEPTVVNMKLVGRLKVAFDALEKDGDGIYAYLGENSKLDMIKNNPAPDMTTIEKYEYLNSRIYAAYAEYKATYGLTSYEATKYDDENGKYADRGHYDNDLVKPDDYTYTATEDELTTILTALDKIIGSDLLKGLIGEKGLSGVLNGLLTDTIYTDEFINTVVQLLYPLVAQEFAKVWADLPDVVKDVDTGVAGAKIDVHLQLQALEEAMESIGLYLFPTTIASHLPSTYAEAKKLLSSSTVKSEYDLEAGEYVSNPWNDPKICDEDGKLAVNWGVNEKETLEEKRAAFIDAASYALEGLKPLLLALLSNVNMEQAGKIGTGYGSTKVVVIKVNATVDIITLNLFATANAGYNNLLVPIFELLGLDRSEYYDGNTFRTTKEIVEGIFLPIETILNKLAANPATFVADALPGLVYALETNMVPGLLSMLKTGITYRADAHYVTDCSAAKEGDVNGALEVTEPIKIDVGAMLDISSLEIGGQKLDLSLNGLLGLVGGLLGIELPELDAAEVATLGDLVTVDSIRSDAVYGDMVANGKAFKLKADRADVVYFILDFLADLLMDTDALKDLVSGIVAATVKADDYESEEDYQAAVAEKQASVSEILNTVFSIVKVKDKDDAIAAVAELFNPETYDALGITWADTSAYTYETGINGFEQSSLPYLKYDNEWTRDKAEYLMNNIDTLVAAVLGMVGSDVTSVSTFLNDAINGLYKNETIEKLVTALVGLGYKEMSNIVDALVKGELGIDLKTWAASYPEYAPELEEGAEAPDFTDVATIAKYTAFEDGDSAGFAKALAEVLAPFTPLLSTLLGGVDLTLLNSALTIKGYNNYADSVGLLLSALGIDPTLTADIATDPAAALEEVLVKVFKWLDDVTKEDAIKNIVELLPNLVYFLESNGLSVALINLLMPVLALVDTVRPIADIDIDAVLSVIVSDLLESVKAGIGSEDGIKVSLDLDKILAVISGEIDITSAKYAIHVKQLDVSEILRLVDVFLGTSLSSSALADYGLMGLCAGKTDGTYAPKMEAADIFTIVVTAILEAVQDPCYLEGGVVSTNGAELCKFIQNALGADSSVNVAEIYNAVIQVINGFEISYTVPNWGYMFGEGEEFSVNLPPHTIEYLAYDNDWTEATAKALDANLDELVDIILNMVLKDNSIAGLLNSILEDKVYTDENLKTVVELLVNLLAKLDESLYNTIGTVVDVNIGAWFDMCDKDADGKYVLKDGYFNVNGDKEAFVAAIKEILEPANSLLSFLFFGTSYNFFTGSEKNDDDTYKYNDVISINGGQGYAYGIVPILEALGCTLKAPEAYKTANGYDVPAAVEDIFNALLAKVDEISGKPAHEVLALLPNILYFLNADGIKAAVNSLLAPVDAVIGALAPVLGIDEGANLGSLLVEKEVLKFNISDLSADVIYDLLESVVTIPTGAGEILRSFYIGELTQFTSANGEYAYKMTYTDKESRADMITIVLSFALELFKANSALFSGVLPEGVYDAVISILTGFEVTYTEPNWITEDKNGDLYHKYANDWTEDTAATLEANLGALVDYVLENVAKLDTPVGTIIENALADNLYKDDVLNSVVELVVGALKGLNQDLLVDTVGAVLGADVDALFAMVDENGKCTKTWNVTDKASFAAAFGEALAPANRILAWLFFGGTYTFLNDSTGADLITITGGEGYMKAIVPILEALGCEVPTGSYDKTNASEAVKDVIMSVLDRVDALCSAESTADMLDVALDLIANVIYFVSSDGVKSSVNNLLAPVTVILKALEPVGVKLDLATIIPGVDLTNLGWDTVLGIVADKLGVTLSASAQSFIKNFYIADCTKGTSANGNDNYTITLTDATRADLITIVLGIAIETFKGNSAAFSSLLPDGIYNAIIEIISGLNVAYTEPNWITEDKNGDLYHKYANDWTTATAATLEANLGALVDFVLENVAKLDTPVGTIIENALADKLYKDDVLNSVVELVVGALKGLDKTLVDTVGAVLGADVDALFAMVDENGKCTKTWNVTDKASFAKAFGEALAPANRILAWLFFGGTYTFLDDGTGADLITITGGDGYMKAIVPILEALGCKVPTGKYDKTNASEAVKDVIMSVLDRVDALCSAESTADMLDVALDLIANVIYFVSSDGVKSSVNNLLAPVTVILKALEPVGVKLDLATLIPGVDLTNLGWDTVLGIVADKLGVTLSESAKSFIKNFYIEDCTKGTSANGNDNYTITLTDATRADLITIVLGIALETFVSADNASVFEGLIGESTYKTITALLKGSEKSFEYADLDWAYMLGGDLEKLASEGLPARTSDNALAYAKYTNNWNIATAEYLKNNLQEIVDAVIAAVTNSDSTVGDILEAAIAGNLYKDEILDKVIELVVGALKGLDKSLVETVGAVLGADVDTFFAMVDEDGKCTKTWGITDKASFAAAFGEALAPANRILAWLFFGGTYTFLDDGTGADLITITGGEGYNYAIVPILEALGCKVPAGPYDKTNASEAVKDVIMAVLDKVDDLCSKGTIDKVLDILPNIVYFINANGLPTIVNNLLQPVYFLLETLEPMIGEVDLDKLIGFPITNITFETIFDLVADLAGLVFKPETKAFIENFYMGKVEAYESANGRTAYKMTYTSDEGARDMITILLSIVLETMEYKENEAVLTKLLGEDIYKAISNVFAITEAKPLKEFEWLYTDIADTGVTLSGVKNSGKYANPYNEYWTKDKAMYIADNLDSFVTKLLGLLGLKINGKKVNDVDSFVDVVVSGNLYTQANADKIINLLKDLTGKLSGLDPYGKYIADILKTSVNVDIHAWDNMKVTVKDGDMESFAAALAKIIAPAAELFKVLLAGEDVKFFVDIDGGDIITIPGSEGYAYGIIPILEALGCKNIKTPDQFKAILASDPQKAVRAVIDPLFNRLADIEKDPLNKVLDMLPAIIYFINSKGVDTSVRNIVNSIDTVLIALEPIIGKTDILTLVGVDLGTIDFDWIVNYAINWVYEKTGNDLTPVAMDAISELTVGEVKSYKSVNGETYYTMKYANKLEKADMVTIVLRLLTEFLVMDGNIKKVEAILANYIEDEKTYNNVCALLETLAKTVKEDPTMSRVLYIEYYIFYGLNQGVQGADGIYNDVNEEWLAVIKSLDESDNPYVKIFSEALKELLDHNVGDIISGDGVAPNGFIAFFQKIGNFFRSIIDFFKNLFK